MFDNIGRKIKTLAQVLCWIGIVASIIAGIVVIANGHDLEPLGVGIMAVGPLLSWVGSFFLYGFGQLVDDTQKLREHIVPDDEDEDGYDYDDAGNGEEDTTFRESDFKIVPGAKCLMCDRTEVPLAAFTMSDDNTPDGYICADCAADFERE